MPCVSILFPCICHFLPWAVWCLACLYISCTVIASMGLDAVNTIVLWWEVETSHLRTLTPRQVFLPSRKLAITVWFHEYCKKASLTDGRAFRCPQCHTYTSLTRSSVLAILLIPCLEWSGTYRQHVQVWPHQLRNNLWIGHCSPL